MNLLNDLFGFDVEKTEPTYAWVIRADGTESPAGVYPTLTDAALELSGERGRIYGGDRHKSIRGIRYEKRESTVVESKVLQEGRLTGRDWRWFCYERRILPYKTRFYRPKSKSSF
jgi:hypothetical protein